MFSRHARTPRKWGELPMAHGVHARRLSHTSFLYQARGETFQARTQRTFDPVAAGRAAVAGGLSAAGFSAGDFSASSNGLNTRSSYTASACRAWPTATISCVESDDVPPWYRWLPSTLLTYSTALATWASSSRLSGSEMASHSKMRPVDRN